MKECLMKLAEALQERADLNRKIGQLRQRLNDNALVQEGETTPEEPEQLLKELNACLRRLEELMIRINLTNSKTMVGEDTLTEMIARRDCLRTKLSIYQDLISNASQKTNRARFSEIKILSAVDVKKLQKDYDRFSRQLRQLDNKIQETNWLTDLME